jgi:hypothetical protein
MIFKTFLLLSCLATSLAAATPKLNKRDRIEGVLVQSGKHDETRYYSGSVSKILPFKISTVKNSITNFNQRCNNSYKEKRRLTDKSMNCKYHNDNLIETIIVKELKSGQWQREASEIERFILGRRVYNRGDFGYYEMVQIFETRNDQNQKTIKILQTMLSDREVQKYLNPAFQRDSAFDQSSATFILTELSSHETSMEYQYMAQTQHWILNKEISVPQVFSSISKSINDLFKTVDAESMALSSDIASN